MKEKKRLTASDVVILLGIIGCLIYLGGILVDHFFVSIPELPLLVIDLTALGFLLAGLIVYLATRKKK